tara:strand:- start:68 stop:652 length:585 start_codon:yes stop_codon:yes gene_type:complete
MSRLNVDKITGATGTSSGAPITLSGDTATLSGTGVTFPAGGTGNPISVAVIVDQKSDGTHGGDFNSGAWRTRDLNTEVFDPDGIVSISSNQFTLAAGTYLIEYSAPGYDTNTHQTKLYDITGSADLNFGTSEYSGAGDAIVTRSFGKFIHTITSANVYEIRHYAETTKSGSGFGIAAAPSNVEVYTMVTITKLK